MITSGRCSWNLTTIPSHLFCDTLKTQNEKKQVGTKLNAENGVVACVDHQLWLYDRDLRTLTLIQINESLRLRFQPSQQSQKKKKRKTQLLVTLQTNTYEHIYTLHVVGSPFRMEWLKNAIVHYSRFQSEINPFQLSRVQHLSFFVSAQLSFVTSLNLSQLGLDSEMLGKLSLRSFTGLRSLNLDTNDIDQMPIQFIKSLSSQLHSLSLRHNQLLEIPKSLVRTHPRLERLDFSHNLVSQVPNSLSQLENLTELQIHNNLASHLPLSLARLLLKDFHQFLPNYHLAKRAYWRTEILASRERSQPEVEVSSLRLSALNLFNFASLKTCLPASPDLVNSLTTGCQICPVCCTFYSRQYETLGFAIISTPEHKWIPFKGECCSQDCRDEVIFGRFLNN